MSGRYAQCDGTCTVDCGHCKGAGRPADVTREPTGGQGLREAVARAAWDSLPATPHGWDSVRGNDRAAWLRIADAVLTLPELAALIADAERVQRVRELVAFYDRHEYGSLNVDDLRRALDGEPQP